MSTIPDWSRNVNPFRRIRKSLPRTAPSPVLRRNNEHTAQKRASKSLAVFIPHAKALRFRFRVQKTSLPLPCTKKLRRSHARVQKIPCVVSFYSGFNNLPAKNQKKKPLGRGLARSIEIKDDAQDDEHRGREEKERPEVHYALGQRRAMTFTSLASYSFTSGSSSSSERTLTRSRRTSEEMTTPLPASVSTSAPTRGTRLFLST